MLGVISVHLESDVEFVGALGLGTVGHVDVVLHPIQRDSYEVRICRVAIDLPGKVMPGVSRWHRAGDACVAPCSSSGIPDVPDTAILDVALGAEDELAGPGGLVDFE